MSTITEGLEVRMRVTGVVVRFHETGQAIVRWQNGTIGIVHPNDLMPSKDHLAERLEELMTAALKVSRLKGRKEGETLVDWLSRLPSDVERFMR